MATYIDGTPVKVGDVFASTRAHTDWTWRVTALANNRIYWKSVEFGYEDSSPEVDAVNWYLKSAGLKKIVKKSGFGKWIAKVEK